MTTLYLISLIAAHFVGDWLLQSRKMATTKSSHWAVLTRHVITVTAALVFPVIIFAPDRLWLLVPNALLHAFIDWNIWSGYKASIPEDQRATHRYWEAKAFYDTIAVDQFLHLFLIILFFA